MKEAQNLKIVWSSIFRRKGGNGIITRLFDDLENANKDKLLKAVQCEETELPIVGGLETEDDWLLVTTQKIAWSVMGKTESLSIKEVRDVIIDLYEMQRSGKTKSNVSELIIITKSNEKLPLKCEAGAPLLGLWNILKNISARNQRPE